MTETKVSSPRTLRSNADVKKSTEQFKEPVKQAKIKTKTKAKTKAKIKAKKKAEDSAEEKAKREVLANSSDEEPQVKQEDFALFDETRNSSRDGWIKESIKRKWSFGLFWAVGAAEKKKLPTAISMQLFGVVFSTFCGQNKFRFFLSKNILASALKSCIA